MKIVHLSSSDISGGAPKAAFRLNEGLGEIGIDSAMLVDTKSSDHKAVFGPDTKLSKLQSLLNRHLDQVPVKMYSDRTSNFFSPAIASKNITAKLDTLKPDLINLHWIGFGYLRIESIINLSKPLVWTLHDTWPFTGGCHYFFTCSRYRQSCGNCPELGSKHELDLSKWIWWRKKRAWRDLNLTVVAPSHWMAESARQSSLFSSVKTRVIPGGLDSQRYKPTDRQLGRHILSLPQDKKLILFAASGDTSDKRKGFHLLQSALKQLSRNELNDIELVVLGSSEPRAPLNLGMRAHYMGRLSDDVSIALVFSSVDAFVAPSMEDNLPNTILEAMACGTPCVAFSVGGIPDLIEHGSNGVLVRPFETDGLARGISWILDDEERRHTLSRRARQKVEKEFDIRIVARKYQEMYSEILEAAKMDGKKGY